MGSKNGASRRPAPGWFTVEHDRALDELKKRGRIKPSIGDQEVFADFVAAGYAKKEGDAFVYIAEAHFGLVKRTWRFPKQQAIIWIGIACLGFLCLYVPWKEWERPAGYGFIFAPPERANKIDLLRIALPMLVVLCATIAGAFFTRDKTGKPAE